MRTFIRAIGFVGLTLALTFGIAGLVGVNPVFADHTPDDVVCPVTHCVQAVDLASGDLTNYAEDGTFERIPAAQLGAPKSWPTRTGSPGWTIHSVAADCQQGARCARRSGNGTAGEALMANGSEPEVRPGESLRISGMFTSLTAANGTAGFKVQWILNDGSITNSTPTTLSAATPGWRPLALAPGAPAGAVRARISLIATNTQGTWLADAIEVRRFVTSALLAPNSVDSGRVINGSLTLSDLLLTGATGLDSRYPTRTELTGGTPNTAGNPVSWGRLYNMPSGFADGVDNQAPKARSIRKTSSGILCNAGCDVLSLPLPAGTFWFSAKAVVEQLEDDEDLVANCALKTDASGVADESQIGTSVGTGFHTDDTLALQGLVTGPATTLRLFCSDHDVGDSIIYNAVLSYIEVST